MATAQLFVRSLRSTAILVIVEQLVIAITGTAILVVLARSLGPGGVGDWKLLTSAQNIALYLMGFGLTYAVTRYAAEFAKDGRYAAVRGLLFRALGIRLVAVTIAAMVFLGSLDVLDRSSDSSLFRPDTAFFVTAVVALHLANDLGRSLFTGLHRRDLVALVHLLSRGFLCVAVLVSAAFEVMTVKAVIVILMFALSLELLVYAIRVARCLYISGSGSHRELDLQDKRRIRRFAGFQWLFQLAQVSREYSVDNYLLLLLRGVEEVGIYGAGVVLPALVKTFSPSRLFAGVWIAHLIPGRTERQHDVLEKLSKFFYLIQKVTAVTVWPVILLGIAFAEDIVFVIFGSSFHESILVMQVLLAFMLVSTAADAFYSIALALERSRLLFATSLWGIANLAVNLFFLIPRFGALGVAIGTGATTICIYFHFHLILAKEGRSFRYPWRRCSRVLLALSPLLLMLIIVGTLLPGSTLPIKLLFAAGGLIIYIAVIRTYSPFEVSEKRFIEARFGRPSMLLFRQKPGRAASSNV